MELLARFADALEYPQSDPAPILDDCLAAMPEGGPALRRFRDFVHGCTSAELQERYTSTFDFNPGCCLFAGHHLLGGDDRRAAFMARLNEHYRKASFSAGRELPDHFSVMLRFVSANRDDRDARELVTECIVPALTALTAQLQKKEEPWADLTGAIALALEELKSSA
jgi:nitrate reductase delta subunit